MIDLREMECIYKSPSVRLVYLHLVLAAGYHDEDRDVYTRSVRATAADVGLTISATRHALGVLMRAGLLHRTAAGLVVTKWVARRDISPRKEPEAKKAVGEFVNEGPREKGRSEKTEEEKREEYGRVLWNAFEAVKKNPRSIQRGILDNAYAKGECAIYGIPYSPKNK